MSLLKMRKASPRLQPRKQPLTLRQHQERIRNVIQQINREGTIDNHYWFVAMIVPEDERDGPEDDGDGRIGCYPGDWFPVIRMRDDPHGNYAQIMTEIFRSNNQGVSFYPSLTTQERLDLLADNRWYVWGELVIDKICERCGQVYQVNSTCQDYICECRNYWGGKVWA